MNLPPMNTFGNVCQSVIAESASRLGMFSSTSTTSNG